MNEHDAIASALRFDAPALQRMGVAVTGRDARRIRLLMRLRWVPFLRANLRAQRRLFRAMGEQ